MQLDKESQHRGLSKLYGSLPSWWLQVLHSLTFKDVQWGADFVSAIFTGVDAGVGELQIPQAQLFILHLDVRSASNESWFFWKK